MNEAVTDPGTASPRLLPWILFGIALVARLAAIHGTIGFDTPAVLEPAADSRIHMMLVQNLLSGHGYSLFGSPTGWTPPLYVFLLTGIYRLTDDPAVVRCLQAVLGAGDCVLLYMIGRRLFDRTTALVAAGIFSMYPMALYLAGLHLTENLFLPLLLVIIFQAVRVMQRPDPIGACVLGGLVGLAALTRAVFVGFLPLLFLWAMVNWGVRRLLTYQIAGLALLAAVTIILPWSVRNYIVLHDVVPVQSNGGLMFWVGNNPYADGGLIWPTARTWTATRLPDNMVYGWHNLTIAQENRLYLRTALSWIRNHPVSYLHLLPLKLMRLYGFTKAVAGQDVLVPLPVAIFQWGVLISAGLGLLLTIRRWRTLSFLLLLIVFTNVMVLVFSGATRYEVPMVPSLMLFSGFAVTTVLTRAIQICGFGPTLTAENSLR